MTVYDPERDHYLTDLGDFSVVEKSRVSAFQQHQNSFNIDPIHIAIKSRWDTFIDSADALS